MHAAPSILKRPSSAHPSSSAAAAAAAAEEALQQRFRMRPSSAFGSFKLRARVPAAEWCGVPDEGCDETPASAAPLSLAAPPLETVFDDVTTVPPPLAYTVQHKHNVVAAPLQPQPVNYVVEGALLQPAPASSHSRSFAHRSLPDEAGGEGGVRTGGEGGGRTISACGVGGWKGGLSFDDTMMLLMGNELGGSRDVSLRQHHQQLQQQQQQQQHQQQQQRQQQQQQQHHRVQPLMRPGSAKESVYSDALSFIQDDDDASDSFLSDAAYADGADVDVDDDAEDDDRYGDTAFQSQYGDEWVRGGGSSSGLSLPLFSSSAPAIVDKLLRDSRAACLASPSSPKQQRQQQQQQQRQQQPRYQLLQLKDLDFASIEKNNRNLK